MKRLTGILVSAVMLASSIFPAFSRTRAEAVDAGTGKYNYAEALQKSMFFYECQQAGPLPDWNRVSWRTDSTMKDFIHGGWYDAGDHVKFNLPMAYSAAVIAWGLYQYGDDIQSTGQREIMERNLEFVLDYFVDCDLGDEVVYQVGNGQEDHTWWGAVDMLETKLDIEGKSRPYYTTTDSAVCGEMAAALAAGYCALKGSSNNADIYLEHAENIFGLADATRSDADYNNSDAQGFYQSRSFYDDLFFAANWLYMATGEKTYLDKAKSYIPSLGKELGSDELKYSWTLCWDDVQQGGMLLYAINTGDSTYKEQVRKQLDYMTTGYNGNSVKKLEGGLAYIDTWGCLRYACSAGFIAAVATDTLFKDDAKKDIYTDFYETQINYCLGDNPLDKSYVVGFGKNPPVNVHHRSAHGSWKNAEDTPVTNRHILYGALAGGPNADGSYEDNRGNYINNEVACDYNAGFTALLCKMCSKYGGEGLESFPVKETPDGPEYYVEAMIKQLSGSGVSLSLKFTNKTAWPARYEDNLSYRYYVDVTEVIEKGFKPEDVVVRIDRDQSAMYSECKQAEITDHLVHYKDNIYYIEVKYPDGRVVIPTEEGRYQCETMVALVFPDYQSGWDALNDYSNGDLLDASGNALEDGVMTDKITVYKNGVLIYGTEPDGTTAGEVTEIDLKGDVNLDGHFTTADVVEMCKYLVKETELKSKAFKNGDITEDGILNVFDLILMKRSLLK